jgi:hypothetical protein
LKKPLCAAAADDDDDDDDGDDDDDAAAAAATMTSQKKQNNASLHRKPALHAPAVGSNTPASSAWRVGRSKCTRLHSLFAAKL